MICCEWWDDTLPEVIFETVRSLYSRAPVHLPRAVRNNRKSKYNRHRADMQHPCIVAGMLRLNNRTNGRPVINIRNASASYRFCNVSDSKIRRCFHCREWRMKQFKRRSPINWSSTPAYLPWGNEGRTVNPYKYSRTGKHFSESIHLFKRKRA